MYFTFLLEISSTACRFLLQMAESKVTEFFNGKNIFITGGTGFVGIALIEKILRSIPNVGTIYLLMRPKKGKEIQERLAEIKANSAFDKLKELKNQDELEQVCISSNKL